MSVTEIKTKCIHVKTWHRNDITDRLWTTNCCYDCCGPTKSEASNIIKFQREQMTELQKRVEYFEKYLQSQKVDDFDSSPTQAIMDKAHNDRIDEILAESIRAPWQK